MSQNLFKESSATARGLGEELRRLIGDLDPAVGEPLLDRLPYRCWCSPGITAQESRR